MTGAKLRFNKHGFFCEIMLKIVYKTRPETTEDMYNRIIAAFASLEK